MVGGGLAFTGSIIPGDCQIKRSKHPGRVPADDHTGWHVVEDHRVNSNHRVTPNPYPWQDRDLAADPDVGFDDHRSGDAWPPAFARRFGVGEMVTHLAGTQHTIRPHLDALCGDDGTAV